MAQSHDPRKFPKFFDIRDWYNSQRERYGDLRELTANDDHLFRYLIEGTIYAKTGANYGCVTPGWDTQEMIYWRTGLGREDQAESFKRLEDFRLVTRWHDPEYDRDKIEVTYIWDWLKRKNPGRNDLPRRPSLRDPHAATRATQSARGKPGGWL